MAGQLLPLREIAESQTDDQVASDYVEHLESLMTAAALLAVLPLQQMTFANERMQTLAPVLEPTAYQRGGGQRLHEQRRVIDAARALQRVLWDLDAAR